MLVRPVHPLRWLVPALAIVAGAESAFAQDVEMLGRRYGTQPPASYYEERARDPQAFQFRRGRAEPARMQERARAMSAAGTARLRAPARALGPRGEPVEGTYRIPLLLALFSDSPAPPYTQSQVQTAFFDAPTGTVSEYYDEVSGGKLQLIGETRDWVRSSMSQSAVTQGESALACCGIGDFVKDLIGRQTNIDWGLFDNDGPDGLPNSGDDDGYVDALAIMHPTRGAECGGAGSGGRIWSHKWSLSFASSDRQPHATGSPRAGGGVILIDDYFVQGVLSCRLQQTISEIGVFVHETGHAFGLPDLYDTRPIGTPHSGAGNWDVMAHGTWGCNDRTPERPCHMGAWSKAMLGWVDVITLDPDMDHGTITLAPVETSRIVYRVDAQDGSNEYFLLENRRNTLGSYDQGLPGEGLLVWQIDQNALDARWLDNLVNAFDHMAVWLRQADGADHLGKLFQSPGDGGDPFPGTSGKTVFHAVSNPSSNSWAGSPTGLTLVDIEDVAPNVRFRALTRFTRLTVQAAGAGGGGLFRLDGQTLPGTGPHLVLSPPFASRTLEAAVGDVLAEGQRFPFVQWNDAPAAPRARVIVTPLADAAYEAQYGSLQYQLAIPMTGGVNGVAPGTVTTAPPSPDLWFAPGTVVQLSIAPKTGFSFLGWTGALADQPNPTTLTLNTPIFGGADFQLVYMAPDLELAFPAAVAQSIDLVAAPGTEPIVWSVVGGSLPPGIQLQATPGRLSGAALASGSFAVTLEAADAIGLTDQATIAFEIEAPTLSIEALASRFLLGGPALDPLQEAYVDHHGNGDGAYDLGDFRAWVLANPSLPLSTSATAAPQPSVVVVPVRPSAKPRAEQGGAR